VTKEEAAESFGGEEVDPATRARAEALLENALARDHLDWQSERDRAARARTDEKQRKRDEKSAKRKAKRTEAEGPPDDEEAQHAGVSSAKSVPTN